MKSYNNVTLVGRVIYEPVDVAMGKQPVADFCVEVSRPYKDSEGKEVADSFMVKTYGKLAEICKDYCKQGCLVLVNGRLAKEYTTVYVVGESINVLEYSPKKGGK